MGFSQHRLTCPYACSCNSNFFVVVMMILGEYRALWGQAWVPIYIAHEMLHLQHALLCVAFYACPVSVVFAVWCSCVACSLLFYVAVSSSMTQTFTYMQETIILFMVRSMNLQTYRSIDRHISCTTNLCGAHSHTCQLSTSNGVSSVNPLLSFRLTPPYTPHFQTWSPHWSEFLQQKWTKKNRQELAPNICYVISRFNQVMLLFPPLPSPPHHLHLLTMCTHCSYLHPLRWPSG